MARRSRLFSGQKEPAYAGFRRLFPVAPKGNREPEKPAPLARKAGFFGRKSRLLAKKEAGFGQKSRLLPARGREPALARKAGFFWPKPA